MMMWTGDKNSQNYTEIFVKHKGICFKKDSESPQNEKIRSFLRIHDFPFSIASKVRSMSLIRA